MKKEQIVTYVVLGIFCLQMVAIPVNYVYGKIESGISKVSIDWESIYPFNTESTTDSTGKITDVLESDFSICKNLFDKYENVVHNIVSKIEKKANDCSLGRDAMIECYGTFCKSIGLNIIKDSEVTTVALNSGRLIYLNNGNTYVYQNISDVAELDSFIKSKGMNFIYMQCPSKLFSESDMISGIIENRKDSDEDIVCNSLKEEGVAVLDIRDYMPDDYEEYMSCFYRTDHHWKIETGLYATSLLAEYLNETLDFHIDTTLFDMDNFNVDTYQNYWIGSQGKKVSLGYIDAEDFNFLTPKKEQNWTVNIPIMNIQETGDFSIIIDDNELKGKNIYKENPYAAYIYGDQAYMSIVNNEITTEEKVLIIADSFSEAVVPFLAMGVRQVDKLDLRHFTGSLRTFLEENAYDAVIFMVSDAGSEYDLSLHTGKWDFR